MNEIEKYYNLLGITKDSTNEEIYKAYVAKKNELNIKQQNNELSLDEYNQKNKELELAYGIIVQNRNSLPLNTETQQLEEDLKKAMEKEKPKDITVKRGRLIRKIQNEIKKIKSSDNLSESDKESLKKLEELLENEIDNHKHQLSTRYKNEFLDKKATFAAIFTTLPKGLGLQVKKISNCINEIKQAKSNKERIFGVVDLAKSLGMLAATPVIFTAKFIVEHWYLLLLLLLLLPNLKWPNLRKNNENNNEYNDPEPEVEMVEETEYGVEPNVAEETTVVKNPGLVEEPALQPVPKPAPAPAPVPAPTPNPNSVPSPNRVPNPNPVVPVTPVTPEESVNNPIGIDEEVNNLTVIDSTAKEEYFSLLRQALPAELSNSYTVFDTYQEAIEYCVNEMGLSATEAENVLNGKSMIEKPSIMWLVGKGGFFAESEAELLQNYTTDQLQQIVEDNKDLVNQVVDMNKTGSSVADIFNSLGTGGLFLFVCYELLQYGLAIPTNGASLLLPG